MTSMLEITPTEWQKIAEIMKDIHLLQRREWGDLKSGFGWYARYLSNGTVGAQILFRKLPFGYTIAYIPKGPIGPVAEWQSLWKPLDQLCRQENAIFLKIEPDAWEEQAGSISPQFNGYAAPAASIQPRQTITIDLHGSEENWLEKMKQKTRYNIRLAQKKDVVITQTDDVETFQRLMSITGSRNEFGVHDFHYYQRAHTLFSPGFSRILLASYENQPLAAIMLFFSGSRSWYLYGASSDLERNRMPAYLLQFEAMKLSAQRNCTQYDLWGIPDASEDDLENNFEKRSDGLWGVYRFKRGFGGAIKRSIGAFDRIYHPMLYSAYRRFRRAE